ncbi:MAG: hypothetical protein M3373_02580 [Gemmatimonadota bacterium]|nr:hypothetical protein [Gemmatimonadota bacterium]
MGIENTSGQLNLLRVHDRGSKFGPSNDKMDVEVVISFANQQNRFFGFQLRTDSNGPAREGMLGLLRDGFNHGWTVNIDFDRKPGKNNSVLFRVWLTKPPRPPVGGGVITGGVLTTGRRRPRAKGAKRPTTKRGATPR